MSLEYTSHPSGPGPNELVPSRYAVRIGEIDVLVVSDGVLPLPTAMLAHNVDQSVRAACRSGRSRNAFWGSSFTKMGLQLDVSDLKSDPGTMCKRRSRNAPFAKLWTGRKCAIKGLFAPSRYSY